MPSSYSLVVSLRPARQMAPLKAEKSSNIDSILLFHIDEHPILEGGDILGNMSDSP